MAIAPQSQVEDDIRTIVGGNFTEDALGDEYRRIVGRLRAAPNAYLDTFERLFLSGAQPPRHETGLYLPSFLQLLAEAAPERVRVLATRLLGRYDAALSSIDSAAQADPGVLEALPGETTRIVRHLDQRRRQLRVLLGQPPGGR